MPGVRARLPQSRWHLSRVLKKWMGVCPGGKEPREGISGEGLTRRQTAGGKLQALEEIDTFNTQWAVHHQAPFSSISLRCTPFLTLYHLRHTIQILHSRILTLNNPAQIPSSPHAVHDTAFLSLVSPSRGVTSPAQRLLGSLLGSCWNHHMRDTPKSPLYRIPALLGERARWPNLHTEQLSLLTSEGNSSGSEKLAFMYGDASRGLMTQHLSKETNVGHCQPQQAKEYVLSFRWTWKRKWGGDGTKRRRVCYSVSTILTFKVLPKPPVS